MQQCKARLSTHQAPAHYLLCVLFGCACCSQDGSSILAASVSDCIPGLDTAEDDLCCDDDDTDSEYEDCDDKQPEFIKALTMVFEDWSVTGSNADPASAAAIGYSTALSGV